MDLKEKLALGERYRNGDRNPETLAKMLAIMEADVQSMREKLDKIPDGHPEYHALSAIYHVAAQNLKNFKAAIMQ